MTSQKKSERCCARCDHYVSYEEIQEKKVPAAYPMCGECHCNPPTLILVGDRSYPSAYWPGVEKKHRCGQFKEQGTI